MQQLTIEHKKYQKTTSNQKQVIRNEKPKRDRRESKGRVLAISRRTYRLQNSDVYYVESESCDNIYYFVKFKPDVLEECSCKDNSTRHVKCKHLFAIEFAIKWGTMKDIDKIPILLLEANERDSIIVTQTPPPLPPTTKSYLEDEYTF